MRVIVSLLFFALLGCTLQDIIIVGKTEIIDIQSGFQIWDLDKNGIKYHFTLNKMADTLKIWTKDINFKTPEGYTVGTKFNDLNTIEKKLLYRETGNGYFIQLDSGWTLGFCEGNSCTDNEPLPISKVKWIKR